MEPVIHSFRYSINFLIDQVDDLSDEQMVVQQAGVANHPAWTVGHLTFVLHMIGSIVGLGRPIPDAWIERFGPGSSAVSDPQAYGPKAEVVSRLRETTDAIVAAINLLDGSALDEPFPDPAFLDVFPTVRHSLTQVLVGHTAFHVGQLSVWRRAMGLPSIGRSYE